MRLRQPLEDLWNSHAVPTTRDFIPSVPAAKDQARSHHSVEAVHDARGRAAFTLLEVMIACGIFFMCTFAILQMVSSTLRNARALQRTDIDIGMAAAQVYQTLKTNRQPEGSISGDFGQAHKDYSWEAQWAPYLTNGLLQVEIQLNRRGVRGPFDQLTIWVHDPNAVSAVGGGMYRR